MEPSENEIKAASACNNPADAPSSDVVQHPHRVESLRRTEAVLKEALQAAQMGTWEWALDTDTVTWDENLFRIAGLDAKEPVPRYQGHSAFLTPASWDYMKLAVEKALTTGTPYELDLELVRPDGSKRWVIDRGKARRDASGRITHLYGTLQDITERKRAEQLNQQYEKVVESTDEWIAVIDREYRYVLANRSYLAYHGLTQEQVLGTTLADLLGEDFFATVIKKRLDECFRGKVIHFEVSYHFQRHGQRDLQVSYYPIEGDEGVRRVAFVLQDITERKRAEDALRASEARYRTLFENNVAAIICSTPEGRILDCNGPAARVLGYESPQEVMGLSMLDFYWELDQRASMISRLDTEKSVAGVLLKLRHKEGRPVWVIANLSLTVAEGTGEKFIQGTVIDITRHMEAEDSLRKLSRAVEQSSAAVVITDTSGLIEYVNPKFTHITGYTAEEAIGRTPRFLKSGMVPDKTYQDLWKTVLSGAEWRGELANRKKNGEVYWESDSIVAIRDSGGAITHFLAVKEDITERKRGEEALRAAEEKFRMAFNACPEAMVLCSFPRGVHLEVNHAYLRASGLSREEVMGKTAFEIGIVPKPEEIGRLVKALRKDGKLIDFETVLRWKSGKTVHAIISADRMESGGNACLLVVAKDITERKLAEEALLASEERFRLFMNNSPTISWMKDEQGHYVYVSDTHEDRVGVRINEHMGQTDHEIYPPAIAEQFRRNDRAVLDAGHPIEVIEETAAPDGSVCTWLTYKFPIQDASGQVFVGGIGMDITERKRMEKELQDSFDQLRALAGRLLDVREEERKRVAREIHDQLGQALTAIKIDLSSLIRELPEGAKPSSKRTDSILHLVDESIRVVRRISTELRPGILDDLGLVAAIEWAGEDFEARTGTKCRLHLPHEDIHADPEQATAIFRIFQETLTNVARHAGASVVEVSFAKQGDGLMLEVHDNGNGIPEEKLKAGTSLGLLGMRERAMILGGEVNIRGIPGGGTTVTVRIPGAHHTRGEQRID